ncbi:MAG: OmpA family protein [Azoarcus sp.]|jgi:outer membrane protein OmpA-like peptidoglycan-associated protein|nr:OmpA family protein [Azoarcus sp.]
MNSFVQHIIRKTLVLSAVVFMAACQTPPPSGLTDAQIEALRDIGFNREEGGWELALDGRILFGPNDAKLADDNRATIERVVTTLKSVGIDGFTIEGYTDSTGSESYNHKLSLQRAEVVARYISELGVPYENLTVKARGTANPVADNRTASGRAQNRRVVLIVPAD